MKESKSLHGTVASLSIGFGLSLFFTLLAYIFVTQHLLPSELLLPVVLLLAFFQFLVQSIFFLHLHKKESGWNLLVFITTISLILTVVLGSIWIMHHLNYNMTPEQMNQRIFKDEGMKKNIMPPYK